MEQFTLSYHVRELFVYRIINGYLFYNDLEIRNPTKRCVYDAQNLYVNTYNKALELEILTEREMLDIMMLSGEWDEYSEQQCTKILPKHIEYFQKELFYNFDNKKELAKLFKYLNKAKVELSALHNKRGAYSHLTVEGIAAFSRIQYIIENSTFINDKPIDTTVYDIKDIIAYYYNEMIDASVVRYLSRTNPWTDFYTGAKKNNSSVFNCASVELSEEQRMLLFWSSIYENIYSNDDRPRDEMFDYDDVIDGWLIIKREQANRETAVDMAEQIAGSNKNAQEIFLVAKQSDDDGNRFTAEEIYKLNNGVGRDIIKNRLATINKLGSAEDINFGDIQQQIRIKQAQLGR